MRDFLLHFAQGFAFTVGAIVGGLLLWLGICAAAPYIVAAYNWLLGISAVAAIASVCLLIAIACGLFWAYVSRDDDTWGDWP